MDKILGYSRYWLDPMGIAYKIDGHEEFIRSKFGLSDKLNTANVYQIAFSHNWCRVVIEPNRVWFENNRGFLVPPKVGQLRWLKNMAIEKNIPLINGFTNRPVNLESVTENILSMRVLTNTEFVKLLK